MDMELRKRERKNMEVKPSSDLPLKKQKKKKKRRSLFYVFRLLRDYYIYEVPVNRHHFFPATANIEYSGRSKASRTAGHGCRPPRMWDPYLHFETTGNKGELPKDVALVALGSEIYLIGGHRFDGTLAREVYVIDTAYDYPDVENKSCVLNCGKHQPIAWTVGGNIYVMPHTFSDTVFVKPTFPPYTEPAGKFFERYDPDSNSWTVLPSPPVETLGLGLANGDFDPLQVTSHAVLDSKLLISVGTSGIFFVFDTACSSPSWIKIQLELVHDRLNFLPFDPLHSSPLGGNLVLCYPRVVLHRPKNRVSGLVKEKLGLDCQKDYYVCRFNDVDQNDLRVSIVSFDGSSFGTRWAKFFHPRNDSSSQVTLLGEDLILFAKVGCDYDDIGQFMSGDYTNDIGDSYMSFEVFRVSQATDGEGQYQASGTRSALFKLDKDLVPFLEFFRCFVKEDGLFVN